MRISLKLAGSFALMATLVGLVGYSAGRVERTVEIELDHLSLGAILSIVDASNMGDALAAAHLAASELLEIQRAAAAQPVMAEQMRRLVKRHQDTIETCLTRFDRSLERSQLARESLPGVTADRETSDEGPDNTKAVLARLAVAFDEYGGAMTEFLSKTDAEIKVASELFFGRLAPHFRDRILPLIRTLQSGAEAAFAKGVRNSKQTMARAATRRNYTTLASLAVSIGLGLLVAASIGRPLNQLTKATAELAAGRLDTRVDVRSRDEVGTLARSFNQMAASLQSTTVAKSYVDNVIRSMREMLIVTDADLRIERVNPAAARQLGFAEVEFRGRQLNELIGESPQLVDAAATSPPPLSEGRERMLQSKSGQSIPVWWTASQLAGEDGTIQGVVCVATDISERKAAEEQLRASLREKDVLLKEVHHRVKNNRQIISSLLNLQAQAAASVEAARPLRDSQSRIHSMTLVHQQLYQSDDLSQIDFGLYVRELTTHLARSLGASPRNIGVSVEVESVPLSIDLAIPCGMIVNELVSNAMEHAFPEGRSGQIRVDFRSTGDCFELTVGDNGVGFAEPDANASTSSLGLKVVQALVDQIGGDTCIKRDDGTQFVIRFQPAVAKNSTAAPT